MLHLAFTRADLLMVRDYKKATQYEETSEQIHKRELRNDARRQLEKKGTVHKGDGKDVDHIHMLKFDGAHPTKSVNAPSDLRAITEHKNRGWRKGRHGY
jgi:hypothetical protein